MTKTKRPPVMAGAVSALASEYGHDRGINEGSKALTRSGADDGDYLTVLHSFGPRLAKRVIQKADGPVSIEGYENAKTFRVRSVHVDGLEAIARWLHANDSNRRVAVIRASLRDGVVPDRARRTLHEQVNHDGTIEPPCFQPAARQWVAIDLDGIVLPEGVDPKRELVTHLVKLLPPSFAGADLILQMTGSAGFKPGIRARLWFWLDRPAPGRELRRWFHGRPVDLSTFNDVQLIYSASPLLVGVRDPYPKRILFLRGTKAAVDVPDLTPPPRRMLSRSSKPRNGNRYALTALAQACNAIAMAGEGARHARLNKEAFSLARFVCTGELSAIDMTSALVGAARRAGLTDPDDELLRFIRCGLKAGAHRIQGVS